MSSDLISVKSLFSRDDVKNKFQELLGNRASAFMTSVLQIVSSNDLLKNAEATSIYQSAAVAATLDLPLNNNLGFAYIVPYNSKQKDGTYKTVAQFQMGYKGFRQLALRTGQFKFINATDVREGEIVNHNRLSGEIEFNWINDEAEREKAKVIGYVSYFELINGFKSILYMPLAKVEAHGKKYSQTFRKGFGLWKDDFESMALKTVTKLNLSKNAPLSIEMRKAVEADQSIVKDFEKEEYDYQDNTEEASFREVIDYEDLCNLYEMKKQVLSKEEQDSAERIIGNKEEASFNKLFKILQSK